MSLWEIDRGNPVSTEAQIRTLLDDQKEQIPARTIMATEIGIS